MIPGGRAVVRHIALLAQAALIFACFAPTAAHAFHFPWDQGHDTFRPDNPGDGDTPPGDENSGCAGDPVDLKTGNFSFSGTPHDLVIPGFGPSLALLFTYHAQERFVGPFGLGWHVSLFEKATVTTDGATITVTIRQGDGKRKVFLRNPDGTFQTPAGVYQRLTANANGTFTLRNRDGGRREFDVRGQLTQVADRNGNALSIVYDATGSLLSATDAGGRRLTFTKGPNGRIAQVIDPANQTYSFAYNTNGLLLSVTDPMGSQTRYTYDSLFRLVSIINPTGTTRLTNTYDTLNRVTRQVMADGGAYVFLYQTADTTRVTNPRNIATTYQFNTSGNIILETNSLGHQVRRTWDSNFNPLTVKNAKGETTQFTYDTSGNLTSVTDPMGGLTVMTYEPNFNQLKSITDPRGNATTHLYDYETGGPNKGNRVKTTFPAAGGPAAFATYAYNSRGQLETQTNEAGIVTRFAYDGATGDLRQRTVGFGTALASTSSATYDGNGNVLTSTDPLSHTTSFQYDARNRVTQVTAPAPLSFVTKNTYTANGKLSKTERQTGDAGDPWQTAAFTYDAVDRLKTITDDAAHVTTFTYDLNGNQTKVVDANGNATNSTYDSRDWLTQRTDALGRATNFSYDLKGNLVATTDAKGHAITYSYNAAGRRSGIGYADGATEAFEYDAAGNLLRKRLRSGATVDSTFDALNRLSSRQDSGGNAITYSYDAGGRLARISDSSGPITFRYDALGRMNSTTSADGKIVSYGFDLAGNRTGLTYPDGSAISYTYDNLNRLTGISENGAGSIAQFAYDSLSRRVQLDLGNGTRAGYAYDAANNLTSLAYSAGAGTTPLRGMDYTYDRVGHRLSMTVTGGLYPGQHSYTYDTAYQLTGAQYPAGFPLPSTQYAYDPAGNRTSTTDTATTAYTVNALDQYTDVGGQPQSHNANGSFTSDLAAALTYDAVNRVTGVSARGNSASYRYDAIGRRIEKTVNGATLHFVYAGPQILAEYDGAGNLLRKYIYGPGIDEPLCLITAGSQRYYYHADAQGSVGFLTNSNGVEVETYTIGAYGAGAPLASSLGNRYGFTGREYDAESGLHYMRARYYSATLGRFVQADPVGLAGGANLYSFAGNSAVLFVDPFGLCDEKGWLEKGFEQLFLGNYSDEVTWFGTALQVGTGILGVDLPGDIRDITHDLTHWEWTWDHAGKTLLDTVGILPVVGAIKYADEGAELIGAARKGSQATEGIYEFTATSGKTYVGQSGNIPQRLEQHIASGKLEPGTTVKTTEVTGGKTAREISEQRRINELGGIQNLENIRNPIGPKRQHLLKDD